MKALRATISWLITVLLLAFICAVIVLKLSGWNALTVLSGSMEPNINRGDVVLVEPSKPKVGDVATFVEKDQSTTTHRVQKITRTAYITAGDATGTLDEPRNKKNLIGTVRFTVPLIGWLGPYSPFWPWPLAIAIAVIAMMIAWPLLTRSSKKSAETATTTAAAENKEEKEGAVNVTSA